MGRRAVVQVSAEGSTVDQHVAATRQALAIEFLGAQACRVGGVVQQREAGCGHDLTHAIGKR